MKSLKQEKGSITLFVLISMIFFTMFLIGMYILTSNSESSEIAESARIKEIYEEGTNNIDEVYNTLENELYSTSIVELYNAPTNELYNSLAIE